MYENFEGKIAKCIKLYDGVVRIEFDNDESLVIDTGQHTILGGTANLIDAVFDSVVVEEYKVEARVKSKVVYSRVKVFTDKGFCEIGRVEEVPLIRKKVCA